MASCSSKFEFKPVSLRDVIWLTGAILLTGLVIFGVGWSIKQEYPLSPSAITSENGFAYTVAVTESDYFLFKTLGDSMGSPHRSKTQLFENGQPLGPAHSPLELIRNQGHGKFSHWDTTLYFSTSDNSDPRTNGRFYYMVTAATLPVWIIGALAACFLIPLYLALQPRSQIGSWLENPRLTSSSIGSKFVELRLCRFRGTNRRTDPVIWIIAIGIVLGLYQAIWFISATYRTTPATIEFDASKGQLATAFTPIAGWWFNPSPDGGRNMMVRGQGRESIALVELPQSGSYHLALALSLLPGETGGSGIAVYLNDTLLAELQPAMQVAGQYFELTVPAGVAHEGANILRFIYPSSDSSDQPNHIQFQTIRLRRTSTPADFLAMISQAVLHFFWPAALVIAGALAWQTGRLVGAFGLDWINNRQNSAPFRVGGRSAWLNRLRVIQRVLDWAAALEQAFSTPGWRGITLRLAGLALPFLAYGIILNLSLPAKLLFAAYYALTAFVTLAGLLLYIVFRYRSWLGIIASLTLTLGLFALPLLALWYHVGIHYSAIGGLLPFSDASGYYYDAQRLLNGQLLGWSGRRPMFVGLLTTLLALTGQNLQITLAILVVLSATACYLLAREVQMSHDTIGAVIVIMLLFLFYRVDGGLGTSLTENLGLPLGVISFAVLWRGARERHMGVIWVGLGLLTQALVARAGAFFVLPALMLGGAWIFRGQARFSLRFLVGSVVAVLMGFTSNFILKEVLAAPGSETFSNFSNTLYGLVVGGKGWTQVAIDHPNAREGTEIYFLAWQAFQANPMSLVVGSLKMWQEYFPPKPYHAFSFVRGDTYAGPIQLACYALSAWGLTLCLRRYRQPHYGLLAAAVVGHLASIPFVPSIDGGLRVYAATMPALAVLVAIATAELAQIAGRLTGLTRRFSSSGAADTSGPASAYPLPGPHASITFGLSLAALVLVGPLVTYFLVSRSPQLIEIPCPAGQVPVYVSLSSGSFIKVVEDSGHQQVKVPEVGETELRKTASVVQIKNDIDRFVAGTTLINTYDLKSGRLMWLVAPTSLLPQPPTIARICGHNSTDTQSRKYGVFYVDSVQ